MALPETVTITFSVSVDYARYDENNKEYVDAARAASAQDAADAALSTGGMLKFARETDAREIIVGTETGILHRLRKENPGKAFFPLEPAPLCQNMKKISVEAVLASLRDLSPRVELDAETIRLARAPIDRMLAI